MSMNSDLDVQEREQDQETAGSAYFDELETREPDLRERALFNVLPEQIANAKKNAPAFARILAEIDPFAVTSRAALAALPVIRKSELVERQKESFADRDPFGGLTAERTGRLARIFASPGPIYDPEAARPDYWRLSRALYAAGFRPGEIVHNCFAYHFTPAGAMLESGAQAIGCPVVPAGTGNTELQIRAIADIKPKGYVGTPSFLKIILDKAREMGMELPSLKRGLVSGEALPGALRAAFNERGIDVRQCYASADLGLIAYESVPGEGLIVDEWVIVEIVRPGTGDPVPEGEVGEVVVTTLNPDYPLIRFATGDLSAVLPGQSSCGRTNMRLKGWMGRADQMTKVRGMFVHPHQIAEIAKRHPEIRKARLVVGRDDANDTMTLRIEVGPQTPPDLVDAVAETIQAVTKLRGTVEIVPAGSLPNDGKVIDDVRKHD